MKRSITPLNAGLTEDTPINPMHGKRRNTSRPAEAITGSSSERRGIRPSRKPCPSPSHLPSASSQPRDFCHEAASPRSKEALERLERHMGKLIRAVLRGRSGGNTVLLPDTYEQEGAPRKLYGFTAILCYSRMRFVTFVKRCDAPTMIRCLMEAFEYFGGLPKAALTDRMKSVLLEMEDKVPRWNPLFADFMASIGVAPRVCKAFTPQTKGKIERTVGVVKQSFWAGVSFTDVDDLNRQAHAWCERINGRVHRTTHERPRDRREQEPLSSFPAAFAWERFATEERKVSWDGYLSYDGVLYGLPSDPPVAGTIVQVRERHGILSIWSQGRRLSELAKRPQSQMTVTHPDQFRTVAPAASLRERTVPLGHQRPAPAILTRALAEYDQLCGVGAALEVRSCNSH